MLSFDKPVISPILIGRAREMESLASALATAAQGQGQAILVAGEAGVGKSRLLSETRRRAADRSFITLSGHCFESDLTFPYPP
jgi:predicted ATPase